MWWLWSVNHRRCLGFSSIDKILCLLSRKVTPSQKTKTSMFSSLMLTYTQHNMDSMERIPSAFLWNITTGRIKQCKNSDKSCKLCLTSTLLVVCVSADHRLQVKDAFQHQPWSSLFCNYNKFNSQKKKKSMCSNMGTLVMLPCWLYKTQHFC